MYGAIFFYVSEIFINFKTGKCQKGTKSSINNGLLIPHSIINKGSKRRGTYNHISATPLQGFLFRSSLSTKVDTGKEYQGGRNRTLTNKGKDKRGRREEDKFSGILKNKYTTQRTPQVESSSSLRRIKVHK